MPHHPLQRLAGGRGVDHWEPRVEDVLVRRLAEAASQAMEKGLATKVRYSKGNEFCVLLIVANRAHRKMRPFLFVLTTGSLILSDSDHLYLP